MPRERERRSGQTADEKILDQLRKRFTYAQDEWREVRDEGQKDMRYVGGDPWEPADRKQREEAGRPVLALDELGQYVNQLINEIRQNKRAIQVTPVGSGANDKKSELRAALIRQIEYRSNAQQVYTTMFENTVQRSYGYLRVKAKFISDRSFDQELMLEPIVNPDMVLIDPDILQPDGSDMRWAFLFESWSVEDFRRKFPDAEIQTFPPELIATYPQWLQGDRLQIAEYWNTDYKTETLKLIQPKAPKVPKGARPMPTPKPFEVYASEFDALPKEFKGETIREREVERPTIVSYFTNGIEILKKTPWPGKHIPLVPCFGKVLYVDDGAGSKRRLMSLVRLARDPQMLYCYYRTCEAELVGMTPKTPFIGYVGQFRTRNLEWQKINHEPAPFLEADPLTEATGSQILPLPQRQPYDPPIQALEIGAESARRAIQAAMGSTPLPTQAQRQNEKSGIALRHIEDASQKGNFHFIDHFEAAVSRAGVLLEDLVPHYYDTARDVTLRKPDDTTEVKRINDPSQPDTMLNADEDYDITISTGPSYDSEREAASDFADQLAQNPQVFPLIGPLVVKLKNLGPIGDEIGKALEVLQPEALRASTKKADPQQLQQQLGQAQQQMQQMQQALQEAQQKIQTDGVKAQAQFRIEQMKSQAEREIEQMKIQSSAQLAITLKQMDNAAKLEAARIAAAKQSADMQAEMLEERIALHAEQGHDVGMAAMDHEHTLAQGQQAAALAPPSISPNGGPTA